MAIDPASAGLGSAGLFALGCAILKYGPVIATKKSIPETPAASMLPMFCPEHHHISKTVDETNKEIKTLHEKINGVALNVEHIRGCLEGKED